MSFLTPQALRYIEENQQPLIDLIAHLCTIPAPSNHEELRADFCKKWLEDAGAPEVLIDDALNVICPIGCDGDGPVSVFMAHTDTVFPDMEPFAARIENGKMHCPGVGDDTANLAALLLCVKYVLQNGLTPADGGVVFVANSGEEGLGNLKGSRAIMERYGRRVKQFISFDGSYPSACSRAVGSSRYRVEVLTEGGHSYGSFGNRNAIHLLAQMITDFYALKVPVDGDSKTTYNVGGIQGGTSVNTIAQQASMLFEYRSDSAVCLEKMEAFFQSVIAHYRTMGVTVNVELLGKRPGMGDIDPAAMGALQDRISAIMMEFCGKPATFGSGSTDANIPLSMGIPSVVFGAYHGHGAHTREEYIELDSLPTGFKIVMASILDCFR